MRIFLIKPILLFAFMLSLCGSIVSAETSEQTGIEGRWHGSLEMKDGRRIETVLEVEASGQDWVVRSVSLKRSDITSPCLI